MSFRETLEPLFNLGQKLAQNKMANFAYDDYAYSHDIVNGVSTYDYNQHNNIPIADINLLKINYSVSAKGFRSVVSVLPRMLVNHMFGRISYNLNKVVDLLTTMLSSFLQYLGKPYGIATLDENGRIPYSQLPLSVVEYKGAWNAQTDSPKLSPDRAIKGYTFTSLLTTASGALHFIAGAESHGLWGSTDGKAWEDISPSGASYYNFLCAATDGNITVVGALDHGLYWSTDRKTWTPMSTTSMQLWTFMDIQFADGVWIACSAQHGICYSLDGKNWTQSSSVDSISFNKVLFADAKWVACSEENGLWYSEDDGNSWTKATGTSSTSHYNVIFASGIWVTTSNYGIWWSEDGTQWSQSTEYASDATRSIAYGNGIFVVTIDNTLAAWSEDGKTWTSCTYTGTLATMRQVMYSDGVWLAVSHDSGVYYSEDGKTWSQAVSAGSEFSDYRYRVQTIAYYSGTWVVFPTDNGSWWSPDGENWSTATGVFGDEYIVGTGGTQDLGEGSTAYTPGDRIIFNGSIWQCIPAGNIRTVNGLSPDNEGDVEVTASDMTTPDVTGIDRRAIGRTLTRGNMTLTIQHITYGNGIFVGAVPHAGGSQVSDRMCYSIDGKRWFVADNDTTNSQLSPRADPDSTGAIPNPRQRVLVYANGVFLCARKALNSTRSIIIRSTDGINWEDTSLKRSGASDYDNQIQKICFGGNVWVAQTINETFYSEDNGITWQSISEPLPSHPQDDLAYVNGKWFCYDYQAKVIHYSNNGKIWSTSSSVTDNSSTCIYGYTPYNNLWIAGGYEVTGHAALWRSNNGSSWTKVTTNLDYPFYEFIQTSSELLAYSRFTVMSSTDGKNWSLVSTTPSAGNIRFDFPILSVDGEYITCSDLDSSVYKSSNGKVWIKGGNITTYYQYKDITYGKYMLLVGTDYGAWWSEGTPTNNVQEILDWLLYIADQQYSS